MYMSVSDEIHISDEIQISILLNMQNTAPR